MAPLIGNSSRYHWYTSCSPEPATVKLALAPSATDCEVGWPVRVGPGLTVRVAWLLVTEPSALEIRTEYFDPSSAKVNAGVT